MHLLNLHSYCGIQLEKCMFNTKINMEKEGGLGIKEELE